MPYFIQLADGDFFFESRVHSAHEIRNTFLHLEHKFKIPACIHTSKSLKSLCIFKMKY